MNLRLSPTAEAGWRARLTLDFKASAGRTFLARRKHEGPLVVQRAFHPEGDGVAHVYLLHPPGGVVGGDELVLEAHVGEGAHALLTTPGATKLYRSGGPTAALQNTLRVAKGAVVEWFPQETIVFSGARAAQSLSVELESSASGPQGTFVGWDIVCLGRPGSGETFARGHYVSRIQLQRGTTPLYLERLEVEGGTAFQEAAWGLRGAPVLGTFFASVTAERWSRALESIETMRATLTPSTVNGEWLGLTALATPAPLETPRSGTLVGRYLGPSAERAKAFFIELWRALRPLLLGRPALPPRIWAT